MGNMLLIAIFKIVLQISRYGHEKKSNHQAMKFTHLTVQLSKSKYI